MDTIVIAVHALSAAYVLTLGPVNLLRRRRDRAHRIIGRTWAVAMLLTCVSSFAIHPDGFNWLHGLAVFTLVSVTAGIIHIRRGHVAAHRGNMIGSYIGTTIAFVFAATMPDRAISRMAVDDPGSLLALVALIIATSAVFVSLVVSPRHRRRRPRPEGSAAPTRVAPSR